MNQETKRRRRVCFHLTWKLLVITYFLLCHLLLLIYASSGIEANISASSHNHHVLLTPFPRCLRYSGQSRGRQRWLCIGKWLPFIEMQRPEEFHFISHLYLRKRRRNCANSVLNMKRRNCIYLSLKEWQGRRSRRMMTTVTWTDEICQYYHTFQRAFHIIKSLAYLLLLESFCEGWILS